jgi:hypothetical protein
MAAPDRAKPASRGWILSLIVIGMGVFIAAYGIGRYEAWWTIALAIGAFALAVAAGRRGSVGSVVIGVAISAAIALGMLGAFLVFMGLHPGGAACLPDQCRDQGPGLLVAGLGALIIATVAVVLTVRYARR